MGMRQREWAKRARRQLQIQLGYACQKCGTRNNLQFDCITPQGHFHHEHMDPSWRVSFYRQQASAGNLQLLCEDCHLAKSAKEL